MRRSCRMEWSLWDATRSWIRAVLSIWPIRIWLDYITSFSLVLIISRWFHNTFHAAKTRAARPYMGHNSRSSRWTNICSVYCVKGTSPREGEEVRTEKQQVVYFFVSAWKHFARRRCLFLLPSPPPSKYSPWEWYSMKKMATINSLNSFLRDTEEVKSKSWVKRSSLDSDNYLPHLQVVAYRKSLPYLSGGREQVSAISRTSVSIL